MSTRATITVADEHDSFDIYQHHDGYPDGPHGLVRHIAMARKMAWDLPRFEAADFSAAIIAVLKVGGGSTYLTRDAKAHCDRSFHYRIEPLCEGVSTKVRLTIQKTRAQADVPDTILFDGDIQEAVRQFDAVAETPKQPRELQMLGGIEGALYRAEEEIQQWFKGTPDPDTQSVLADLDDAGRQMCLLRHHLEKISPWDALTKAETIFGTLKTSDANQYAGIAKTEIRLAMDAHRRFQRD